MATVRLYSAREVPVYQFVLRFILAFVPPGFWQAPEIVEKATWFGNLDAEVQSITNVDANNRLG